MSSEESSGRMDWEEMSATWGEELKGDSVRCGRALLFPLRLKRGADGEASEVFMLTS